MTEEKANSESQPLTPSYSSLSSDPTERDSSVTLNPLELDQLFKKIRAEFETDRNVLHVSFFWRDKPYPEDFISRKLDFEKKLGISKEDALKLYLKFLEAKQQEISELIALRDRIEFEKRDVEHQLASAQKRRDDAQLKAECKIAKCGLCGSEFKPFPYQIRRTLENAPVFCSYSCARKFYHQTKKAKPEHD